MSKSKLSKPVHVSFLVEATSGRLPASEVNMMHQRAIDYANRYTGAIFILLSGYVTLVFLLPLDNYLLNFLSLGRAYSIPAMSILIAPAAIGFFTLLAVEFIF